MPTAAEERTIPVTPHAVLSVSADQMRIRLAWLPHETVPEELAPLIVEQFEALGIHPIARMDVLPILQAQSTAEGAVAVTVAQGTPPKPPVHGRVAWGGDFFADGFAVDPETGRIDYRQHAGNPIVIANQHLAVVYPPEPGSAGVDVYGRPVQPDRPKPYLLRAGKNIIDAGGGQYSAACPGRVRLTGGVLQVDDVLDISGSVGLETGNINHPGTVTIHGDIEEGAAVVAEGDVEVHGIVEGATVRCGGDLYVHGGILGSQGCHLDAGGSVRARFILHAHVQAGGHVEVEREIAQAEVHARGAVLVPHGRIAGGTVIAGRGIAVAQAGSEASVPTLLVAGEDAGLERELAELQHQIHDHQAALEKIHHATEAAHRAIEHLNPKQREALAALDNTEAQLSQETAGEIEHLHTLQHRRHGGVLVAQQLFTDTTLGVGGVRLKMSHTVSGPLLALPADEGIRLVQVANFANALTRIKDA